jgi:hypothetical protein
VEREGGPMTSRVMLISPAMSAALREARFDDGCSIDPAGLRLAEAAAGSLPAADQVLVSPTVRCRETAAALGLDPFAVAEPPGPPGPPELAGLDVGRWRGATLAEVSADEPEAVGRWLADPSSAPHGGESVTGLCERVAKWLEAVADPSSGASGSGSDRGFRSRLRPDHRRRRAGDRTGRGGAGTRGPGVGVLARRRAAVGRDGVQRTGRALERTGRAGARRVRRRRAPG